MASKETTIDTPVTKNQFKPGDATQMPTKSYPVSTKIATEGKSNTIDGPCCEGMRSKK